MATGRVRSAVAAAAAAALFDDGLLLGVAAEAVSNSKESGEKIVTSGSEVYQHSQDAEAKKDSGRDAVFEELDLNAGNNVQSGKESGHDLAVPAFSENQEQHGNKKDVGHAPTVSALSEHHEQHVSNKKDGGHETLASGREAHQGHPPVFRLERHREPSGVLGGDTPHDPALSTFDSYNVDAENHKDTAHDAAISTVDSHHDDVENDKAETKNVRKAARMNRQIQQIAAQDSLLEDKKKAAQECDADCIAGNKKICLKNADKVGKCFDCLALKEGGSDACCELEKCWILRDGRRMELCLQEKETACSADDECCTQKCDGGKCT